MSKKILAKINQMIEFILMSTIFLQVSSIKDLDNRHNESCFSDSECPSRMHCKISKDDINLCICESGYSYSHPFARCEPSKKIFRDFRINGPVTINLPKENVHFEIKFSKLDDLYKGNWQYEWLIQDGHEFAQFSGLNTSILVLNHLTPGFILFGISISNESAYGYIPHNLTILSQNQSLMKQNDLSKNNNNRPIAIARDLIVELPSNYAILSGIQSKNAANFKWTPFPSLPSKMVIGCNLNMPELFFTNFVLGRHFLNLTVYNDGFEDTKTVELVVLKGFAEINSIEITLKHEESFTYAEHKNLSNAIEDILVKHFGFEITIKFNKFKYIQKNFQILLIFHALSKDSTVKDLLEANTIVDILNGNSTFKQSFGVLEIETHICTSKCDGHGFCNNLTKECICDDFWMQNIFNKVFYNKNQDCSCPIVAIWIFVILILMIITKIIRILWLNEEKNILTTFQLVKNLLGQSRQSTQRRLVGRLSPIGFKQRKSWNNSVKGVLQNFDSQTRSTNRVLPNTNEESNCYDEEDEEESSTYSE